MGSLAALAQGLSLQPHGGPRPRVPRSALRLLALQSGGGCGGALAWRPLGMLTLLPGWDPQEPLKPLLGGCFLLSGQAGGAGEGWGARLTLVQFCWGWNPKQGRGWAVPAQCPPLCAPGQACPPSPGPSEPTSPLHTGRSQRPENGGLEDGGCVPVLRGLSLGLPVGRQLAASVARGTIPAASSVGVTAASGIRQP